MQASRHKKSQLLTDESKGTCLRLLHSTQCQKIMEYVLKGNIGYFLRIRYLDRL